MRFFIMIAIKKLRFFRYKHRKGEIYMKRVIAIIVSLLMVISMAACSKTNEQPEPEPEKEVISEVSGIVDAIDDSTLELYTDSGQDVDFDISHAEFTTEHDLRAGDIASVEYKGDIADGNTTEFEAVNIHEYNVNATPVDDMPADTAAPSGWFQN